MILISGGDQPTEQLIATHVLSEPHDRATDDGVDLLGRQAFNSRLQAVPHLRKLRSQPVQSYL